MTAAISRYQLPGTGYFNGIRGGIPLHTLAGYAEARRRYELFGSNLKNTLAIPLSGPHEYSPYGAGIVEAIRERPELAGLLTDRWNKAVVISPGTAILGLGSAPEDAEGVVMAEAGAVIMQGKAKFFLASTGVDAVPLTVRTYLRPEQLDVLRGLDGREQCEQKRIFRALNFAEVVKALAANFGFINIEDARGQDLPSIFGALECLRGQCAVWSDDQQGTGVVTAAGMLGWTDLTNKKMKNVRGCIFGAGAGAMGVYDELVNHGVLPENILVTDTGPDKDRSGKAHPLHEDRHDIDDDPYKVKMRAEIPSTVTIERFLGGADFMINLGDVATWTGRNLRWLEDLTRKLAPNPFFAPMTNPEPGITPAMLHAVREDAFYGSGNQRHPNTLNNFATFGYIGAGALMAWAGGVNAHMTVAAAHGLHHVAKMGPPDSMKSKLPPERREYGSGWFIPHHLDPGLIEHEAAAVALAAARSGVSTKLGRAPTEEALALFTAEVGREVEFRQWYVRRVRDQEEAGRKYLQQKFGDRFAPFYPRSADEPAYWIPPEPSASEFEDLIRQMGTGDEHWTYLITDRNEVVPGALTHLMSRLRRKGKDAAYDDTASDILEREIDLIVQIAQICPALGLALAHRRDRVREENRAERPTVFHREAILRVVLSIVPEARKGIYMAFQNIHPVPELDGEG